MSQAAALNHAEDILAQAALLRRSTYRLAGVLENAPQDALLLDPAALEGIEDDLRKVAHVLSTIASAGRAAMGHGDWSWMAETQDERNDASRRLVQMAVDDADVFLA